MDFFEVILQNGAFPLSLLEQVVDDYIQAELSPFKPFKLGY